MELNVKPTVDSQQHEATAAISKVVKETGLDDFRVRVQRKRTAAGAPEQFLTMEGATAEHLSAPEMWLPRIGGGGLFIMTSYHAQNSAIAVSSHSVQVDAPMRDADPSVVNEPDWRGPRHCAFPAMPKKAAPQLTTIPGGPDATPRTVAPATPGEGRPPANPVEAQLAELRARERELAATQTRLEVEAIRRESKAREEEFQRRLDEERRRNDEERKRAAADEERRRAEDERRRVEDERRRTEQAQAQQNTGGGVFKDLAPLVLEFLKSDREFKQQSLNLQLQAQQEVAKIAAASAERQAAATAEVLKVISAKPAIDPQLFSLLTKEDNGAKVMASMGELFSTQAATTMNMLNALVETGLAGGQREPEEPTAIKAMREGVKMLVALTGNTGNAARSAAPPPRPQLAAPPQQEQQQEAEEEVPRAAEPNALDLAMHMVQDPKEPSAKVAEFVIDAIERQDNSFLRAYVLADQDFTKVFVKALGPEWLAVEENGLRVKAVIRDAAHLGIKRGIFDKELLKDLEEVLAGLT